MLARTIPGELRSLAADVRTFIADPSHQFNRARKTRGFLRGKNGGVYQVHSPGLSFLMFPAYYLDRRFAPVEPGSPAQWPARLPAVNSFFLALYVVWSIVIFRFLRRTVETTTWVAWITTLAVVLTLPVAAFPFQFYPELAAGLLLFLVAGHLLSPGPRTPGAAFFYGLLAGYLPWLHVRFSALAGVLALGAVVLDARHDRHSRDSRSMRAFLAGFFLPLALFALYAYRLTGSVLPTAIWSEDEAGPVWSWAGLTHGSVAYLVDRDWGLFAHAPVYLLAIPGYWWMAQRRRDVAWLSGLAFLALLLPAAAHSLRAAVTTPTRLILAVLPLAAVPLAELLARRGRSRLLQVSFALLLVVSLHSALAYNRHHAKHVGPLVDWGFSGWEVNLLFPLDSRQAWQMSPANGMLWIAWIATLLILLCAPAFRQHVQARGWTLPQLPRPIRSIPGIAVALIIAFALLGTSIAAATGVWDKADYRMPAEPPAMEAAVLLDRMGHCAICVSSARGRLEAGSLLASLADVAPSIARRDVVVWDYDDWLLMPGRIRAWYIEANGREPSDEDVGHHLYQWREEHVAPAEIRRRILAAAGKQGPAGGR